MLTSVDITAAQYTAIFNIVKILISSHNFQVVKFGNIAPSTQLQNSRGTSYFRDTTLFTKEILDLAVNSFHNFLILK